MLIKRWFGFKIAQEEQVCCYPGLGRIYFNLTHNEMYVDFKMACVNIFFVGKHRDKYNQKAIQKENLQLALGTIDH